MIIEMKIPSPGESITEVEIANWLKNDGDLVQKDEALCEVETDKATLPLYATASGQLKILVPTGTSARVGDILCSIDMAAVGTAPSPSAKSPEPSIPSAPSSMAHPSTPTYAAGHPSVAAKKALDEAGISSETIQGTGRGQRITKSDVANAITTSSTSVSTKPSNPSPEKPVAVQTLLVPGSRTIQREKLSKLRKTIAKRLVDVKNQTAMLTTFNEIDMTEVMAIRNRYKDAFVKTHDVKLGFMSFFVKATTEALKMFPPVNGQIDGDDMILHDYVDMGIAVSAPKGLMVPVIRNAEQLSLAEIESAILALAEKARNNQLSLSEMTGGTFSITNGGIFGSMMSTPILNPPQSGILGLHNIVERPVAIRGEVKIRPIMYVALSYDHRIIDGKESVQFLYKIKELIEDPVRLLMGV